MQHKKSQYNETLKEFFENIIIFKECLMSYLIRSHIVNIDEVRI